MALRNPRVKSMLQYELVSPPTASHLFSTGIIDSDWTPELPYQTLSGWVATAMAKHRLKVPAPFSLPPPAATGCQDGGVGALLDLDRDPARLGGDAARDGVTKARTKSGRRASMATLRRGPAARP
jgi:hypothetical protein